MTDANGITISNITANAAIWAPDEPATISFKFKNGSGSKILSMRIEIVLMIKDFTGGTSTGTILLTRLIGDEFVMAQVNLANGKSKTYSASFTIPAIAEFYFSENPNIRAVPIYIRYSAGSSYDVFGGAFQIDDLKALNHRFSPQITAMNLVRAKDGLPNDEGENVLTTLKLAVDGGGYDYSRFLSAKLYYARGDSATTADTSIDLTGNIADQLPSAENDPNLIPGTYDKAYDWDFLLVFGDEYEAFYGRFNLGMAFANLHLSGVSTGGACFGGFSTSKFEHPKLESYYPIRPYGGIEAVKDGVYVQELDLDSDAPFKVREDNPLQPTVRVFGHVVEIHGELQPTKKITGSDAYYPICTLPAQYAPEHDVVTLQQGSTQAIWMLRIFNRNHPEHPCKVMFSRYRDGANWADATTSSPLTWLPFHAVWCIDGSVTGDSEALAALLMDSQGYSLRDAGGNDIAIMSATDEPYQLPYTGEQLEAKLGLIDTALQKSGGTMSGYLTLTETPTEDGHATPKRYVDQQIAEIELTPGASAYDIAKKNGFVGSEAEWLESLHGEDGDDGYTPVKNKDYFDGANGKSAYEYAQEGGYAGTEEEFGSDLNNAIQGGGGGGGSAAWKDIDGNPFVLPITGSVEIDGDTLRWDGETAGMVISTAQNRNVVFISDNVPPFEKVQIGIDVVFYNKNTNVNSFLTLFPELGSKETDKAIMLVVNVGDSGIAYAWIVREPGYDSKWNVTFDRPGVYFVLSENGYYKEFTLLNYAWTETKEKIALPIPPIPQDYLPELTELIMVASGGQKYKITINSDGDFVKTQI